MTTSSISKTLSANDTGETGGHQAGILVPKDQEILGFFPRLDAERHNPRCHLRFVDREGAFWEFAFIYYNGRLFGGTRNEYRLTRMTAYIRNAGLVMGDEVILSRKDDGRYEVDYKRKAKPVDASPGVLKLGSGWRVIQL